MFELNRETTMNFGVTFINGVLFGSGLIIAAFVMKALLHIGICG